MTIFDRASTFFGGRRSQLFVVHEVETAIEKLEVIRQSVRQEDRGGLDIAIDTLRKLSERSDAERVSAWLRSRLRISADDNLERVETTRKIRELLPTLGLSEAAHLADTVIANPVKE